MLKKSRKELEKEYKQCIHKIRNKHHIQPYIILEYLYMKQDDEDEALEMITLEIQRALLYNNSFYYNDYSSTVDSTLQQILTELNTQRGIKS